MGNAVSPNPHKPTDDRLGRLAGLHRLGRYRLERELGRGAMGAVHVAVDETMHRRVALKTIHPELLGGQDRQAWLDRFLSEARAAARCHHPNIVTVFDFGEADGVPFISMEYVDGQSLHGLLARTGALDPPQAVSIASAMLSALQDAHSHGVIHRDVKPANILLTKGGLVKVSDFGIARLDSTHASRTGTMVGTPSYMAPEQFTGDPVDPRTDVFAAGVVVFEMLTGGKPFPGKSVTEIMYKVVHEPPQDPADLGVQLPGALRRVVLTALNKAPDARYQSADAFCAALRSVEAGATDTGDDPFEPWADDRTRLALRDAPAAPVPTGPGVSAGIAADACEALTALIGPLARMLVDKQAAVAADAGDLYARLASAIPEGGDRQAFLRRGERVAAAQRGSAGSASMPDAPGTPATSVQRSRAPDTGPRSVATSASVGADWLTPDAHTRLADALIPILGPMARDVVKRESRAAADLDALVDRLLTHIPDRAEQAIFLKALGLRR